MAEKIVQFISDDSFDITFDDVGETEIDTAIDMLSSLKTKGATHIYLERECDIRGYYFRPETEEEKTRRINRELQTKKSNEDHERKTYERLKLKFG